MAIRCIGRSKDQHGVVSQCSHTSEMPSNPARPEWGYLCPSCANAPPNRNSRPQYHVDLPDLDKPNDEFGGTFCNRRRQPGWEIEEVERVTSQHEEIEALELDYRNEIDAMDNIDLAF